MQELDRKGSMMLSRKPSWHTLPVRVSMVGLLSALFTATLILGNLAAPTTAAAQSSRTPRATATPGEQIIDGDDSKDEEGTFPKSIKFEDSAEPDSVVEFFVSEKLVPDGGSLLITLPRNTFTRVRNPGLTSLPLGGVKKAKHFIYHAKFGWRDAGSESGCGISFWMIRARAGGFDTYGTVIITNDYKVLLAQNVEKKTVLDFDKTYDEDLIFPEKYNWVTAVGFQGILAVYVNGAKVFEGEGQAIDGTFATTIYNGQGNTANTFCTYQYGWVWSLPNRKI
jgi:hypothetical protein